MKRFLLCSFTLLLLAACASGPVLPPDEVLKNAARTGQELLSARYNVDGSLAFTEAGVQKTALFTVSGILQNGGEQSSLVINMKGSFPEAGQTYNVEGSIELFVTFNQEMYVKLGALEVDPPHPLLNAEALAKFQGAWWKLQDDMMTGESVTPEPSLLKAQSEVIRLVEDKGTETLDGRRAYHYLVTIDKEKLVQYLKSVSEEQGQAFDESATRAWADQYESDGEIWIDAETYHMLKIEWKIKQSEQGSAPLDAKVTIRFSDFNEAPTIAPPTDYQVFSPFLFLPNTNIIPNMNDPQLQQELERALEEGLDATELWTDPPVLP